VNVHYNHGSAMVTVVPITCHFRYCLLLLAMTHESSDLDKYKYDTTKKQRQWLIRSIAVILLSLAIIRGSFHK